jgi:hypothetical protein
MPGRSVGSNDRWSECHENACKLPGGEHGVRLVRQARLDLQRWRRRSHRNPGAVPPLTSGPNDLWTADFKGEFRAARLPAIAYPTHFVIKRITKPEHSAFSASCSFSLTHASSSRLASKSRRRIWSIHFCNVLLTRLDERDYTLRDWSGVTES